MVSWHILTFRIRYVLHPQSGQRSASLKPIVVFYLTFKWKVFGCSASDHHSIIEQVEAKCLNVLVTPTKQLYIVCTATITKLTSSWDEQ